MSKLLSKEDLADMRRCAANGSYDDSSTIEDLLDHRRLRVDMIEQMKQRVEAFFPSSQKLLDKFLAEEGRIIAQRRKP